MKRKIYYIFIMLLIAITLVGCGGGSNEPPTDKVKVDFNNLVVEYDGKVHSLEIEGKLPSGVYVTYENNEHTEPGEYNVIVYFHGDYEKYGLPEKLEATLIIEGEVSKAEVWFDSQNFVYDGKPHSIYVSGYIPEGITVKYNGNDQVEPGQYLVKAYLVGDIEKYGLPYELEAWMYIDAVDVSFNWQKQTTFQYDGTKHSIYVEGKLPDNVWIEYEGNEQVMPGEYLVTAYFQGDYEKYGLPYSISEWMTIIGKDIEYNFQDASFSYDGRMHSIYVEGNIPADVWIEYEGNEQIEPGQYLVIAHFRGNYDKYGLPERLEAWMTILQNITINVEFNSQMFEYDGTPHSIEVEGFIPGDVVVRYEGNNQVEPGEYIVTAIFVGNYQAYGLPEKLEALLIIYGQTEAVDIYFDSRTFEYDGKSHSIYVEGNIPDDIWIEYIGNDQTEPGEYLVTAVLHGDYEKYGLPEKIEAWMNIISNNELDISQVIFDSQTFTFDGNVHSLEAINLPEGAWVTYENNDQIWVGEYVVYAEIHKEGCASAFITAVLSIVEKEQEYIKIEFEENTTFVYNGSEQSIYIDRTNVPDCIEVYYDGNGQVDAGSYFVYAYLSDPSGQYLVDECIRGKMIIEKAEIDIKFETAIFDYNETYHSLSYEGELPNGLYVTYQNNGKIYPGEYEVTAVINGYNKNYNYPEKLTAMLIITQGDYFNVKFYAGEDEVHQEWVRSGSQIHSLPNVPYKEGYDGYWGYNNEGIYNDAYIYAIYVPRKYMIYYLVPGEEYDEIVKSEEVEYGQEISLYELEKTGYQFNGWTYNGEIFENTVFEFTEDLWLEAMIEKVKYTITYVDENDVVVKEDYAYYQDQITLPLSYTTSNNEEVYVLNWTFDETQVYSGGALLYFNYTENKVLKAQTLNKELNDLFTFELRGAYLTITDYTGNLKELEIPTHGIFEGTVYEIDTIATNAINSEVLEKLIVPARIYLDQGALGNVSSLTELEVALKDYKFLAYYFGAADYNGYDLVPSTLRKVTLTMYSGQTQSITDYAFYNISSLEEITIANSVYKIYNNAFEGCTSLKKIYIPSRVTEIRSEAFKGCTSLKEIVLPESLSAIESRVFENCSSLESIIIPNGVTIIKPYAFSGCTSLASIVLSTKLNKIQRYAFENTGLLNVVIPETVTEMESFVFHNSTKLQSIEIKANLSYLYDSSFKGCSSLETVVLPNTLQFIEKDVFRDCTSLKYITLPSIISKIDDYAFYNCSSLHSINLPASITELGGYVFSASGLKSVDLSNLNYVPGGLFEDCTLLESIEFGQNLDRINAYTFKGCTALETVVISDSIVRIGIEAFADCTNLKEIKLPNYLIGYESRMLSGCSSLETIELNFNEVKTGMVNCRDLGFLFGTEEFENSIPLKAKEGTTTIYYAPKSFKTLIVNGENTNVNLNYQATIEKIIYNNTVKNINSTAKGCTSLKTVIMSDSVETVINNAFERCTSLEKVTLSNNLTTIGQRAFEYCSSLKSIVIPDSLTIIPYDVFAYCTSLEKVVIGKNVEEIVGGVFLYCTNLTSVQFPSDSKLKTIGSATFGNCEKLEEITLPKSVETIGDNAFEYCTSLKSITLNNNITSVKENAFYSVNLQEVYFNGSVSDWAKIDFAYYSSNPMTISDCNVYYLNSSDKYYLPKDVVISGDVKKIGRNAFSHCDFMSITISEGVEEISEFAFYYAKNLSKLTLPSTLKSTETSAFRYISSTYYVYYNSTSDAWARIEFNGDDSNPMQNAKSIKMLNGKGNFDYVRSVTIPRDVTKISDGQFYNFTELEFVTLHENITEIGSYAFYNTNIKELVLYPSTTEIKGKAMPKTLGKLYYKGTIEDWCKINFTDIESNPMYRAQEIYFYNESTGYTLTKEIVIPDSVTEIKNYQFVGRVIKHITLPNTLKSIGYQGLYLDNLDYVILPQGVETIGGNAFYGYSSRTKVFISETENKENWSSGFASNATAYYGANEATLMISNGIVYMVNGQTAKVVAADYDIKDINILESITINGVKYPVTEIAQYAFYNIDFSSVNIPNTILTIGKHAFARIAYESFDCSHIYIPKTVEVMDEEVFTGRACVIFTDAPSANSGWKSRWNYSSYDSIALYYLPVYYGCTADSLISIDGIYYYINNDHAEVVSVDTDVTSANIKSSITVNEITYPVTHINSYATASNKTIQEIIIPSSITTIKKYAIFENMNLRELNLSTTVQVVEASAFRAYGDNGLTIYIDDEFVPYGWDKFIEVDCVLLYPNNYYFNGVYYGINDSQEATVVAHDREYKEIVVLSEITVNGKTYPVTSISNSAFRASTIEKITIPESVNTISSFAFFSSINLKEVKFIGNGLTTILDQAFGYCYELTNVTLPTSLEYIGSSAFCYTNITEIVIPDYVTTLGEYAFSSCTNLESVVIGKNLQIVKSYTFSNCTSLNSFTFTSGVKLFEDYAFNSLDHIENVYFAGTIEDWCNIIFQYPFASPMMRSHFHISNERGTYTELTEIYIPNSVTEINHRQFSGFRYVTKFVLHDEITAIASDAFNGCLSLSEFTMPVNVAEMNGFGIRKIDKFYYSGTLEDWLNVNVLTSLSFANKIYFKNSQGSYYEVLDVVIPNTVTAIGDYQFSGFKNLRSIKMSNSVITIGQSVFSDCFRLSEVILSDSLTTIGMYSFDNCTLIDDIIIPTSLTTIGKNTLTCKQISRLFYKGNAEMFAQVNILDDYSIEVVTIYYYSETEPTTEGNFWCLDKNNEIYIWQ